MAAYRLVGERDEYETGGAHDQQEHAEVETDRARQVYFAEQRQREVRDVRREERVREKPRAHTGCRCDEEPDADETHGLKVEALLGPARAAGHVLKDDRDGESQSRDEAAAGLVV